MELVTSILLDLDGTLTYSVSFDSKYESPLVTQLRAELTPTQPYFTTWNQIIHIQLWLNATTNKRVTRQHPMIIYLTDFYNRLRIQPKFKKLIETYGNHEEQGILLKPRLGQFYLNKLFEFCAQEKWLDGSEFISLNPTGNHVYGSKNDDTKLTRYYLSLGFNIVDEKKHKVNAYVPVPLQISDAELESIIFKSGFSVSAPATVLLG
jgi:sulfur relay (sulfurtransferase) DsrC/TusE family protein